MSNILNSLFDTYDRKARVAPALLCGLPLLVSAALLIPGVGTMWAAVGGLVLYCGGAMLLAQLGRDQGKIKEPRLYERWGGKPSVAMLRHRDGRLDPSTKERYRAFLSQAVPGLALATPEEEQSYPDEAEEGYEAANSWLLARTRDRQHFGLLFRENVNYGFRRNVWALKPWAFALEGVALMLLGVAAGGSHMWGFIATMQAGGVEWWASFFLTVVHALFFALKIRKGWVRLAAEAYAKQLLAACDILEINAPPQRH